MTPAEWVEVVELVEDLWPGTRTWSNADAMYDEFRMYDRDLADIAVRRIFQDGRQSAPSPSLVMGRLKAVAGERGVNITDTGPHVHVWGHFSPSRSHPTTSGPGLEMCMNMECLDSRLCDCGYCKADRRWWATERAS